MPVVAGKGRAGVFEVSAEQWGEIQALTRQPKPTQNVDSAGTRRYWLFQANPRRGDDLREYLSDKERGDNIWWRVTRYRNPREHVHEGDGVVLWQTRGNQPEAAGVYAIGRLTGNLHHSGRGGWQAQVRLDRIRPAEKPVTPQKLKSLEVLDALPVLRRAGAEGSNFVLTPNQWYAFLSIWGSSGATDEEEDSAIPEQDALSSEGVPIPTARKGSSIVRARDSYVMKWPEDALVEQYVVYMGRKGVTIGTRKMSRRLRCDLYDGIHKNLIEAKASVARESIRMAIGELADYRRFVKPRYVSVLLPSRPEKDLETLLRTQGIFVIWRGGKGFADNAKGRFS